MAIRTDLAMEALVEEDGLPKGVTRTEQAEGDFIITKVTISTEQASELVGKPIGEYVTLSKMPFRDRFMDAQVIGKRIAEELTPMLPEEGTVLVMGLGNYHITPDSLGPQVVDWVIATRHMADDFKTIMEGKQSLRPVVSLAPGVMGQTGVETGELVAALVQRFDVAAVIAIDACASRALDRLGTTVQFSDSGIAPGSGVKNNRMALNKESLGVPVIGIVVPTIVDGETFAYDLLKLRPEGLDEAALRTFFHEYGRDMLVTPNEIDRIVLGAAKAVSLGINMALHPHLTPEEVLSLVE